MFGGLVWLQLNNSEASFQACVQLICAGIHRDKCRTNHLNQDLTLTRNNFSSHIQCWLSGSASPNHSGIELHAHQHVQQPHEEEECIACEHHLIFYRHSSQSQPINPVHQNIFPSGSWNLAPRYAGSNPAVNSGSGHIFLSPVFWRFYRDIIFYRMVMLGLRATLITHGTNRSKAEAPKNPSIQRSEHLIC